MSYLSPLLWQHHKCAARVQDILKKNFVPTGELLRLAEGMPELRCFCYVSTGGLVCALCRAGPDGLLPALWLVLGCALLVCELTTDASACAAFVNANLPKGSCIQEQLYPLYGAPCCMCMLPSDD